MNPNATTIAEALQLDELAPKERDELLLDLNELIFQGTMIRVMERMDERHKDGLHKLIDRNATQEDLATYIETHLPDADKAVTDTIEELTADILAVVST